MNCPVPSAPGPHLSAGRRGDDDARPRDGDAVRGALPHRLVQGLHPGVRPLHGVGARRAEEGGQALMFAFLIFFIRG